MQIGHCEHCNNIFAAQDGQKFPTLCRKCATDCESAYFKVYRFIIRNPDMELETCDKDFIADAIKVPPIFILILVREGMFGKAGDKNEAVDEAKVTCKSCKKPMTRSERGNICTTCKASLKRELNDTLQERQMQPQLPEKPQQQDSQGGFHRRATT